MFHMCDKLSFVFCQINLEKVYDKYVLYIFLV